MSGSTDYFNYKWIDDMHYVTSRDDFEKLSGWNNPIDENYLREKIEQSGNQNPEDCTTLLWNECGKAIQQAETNCKSCGEDGGGDSNLECEGCLFRELNPMEGPNRWDPRSQTNRWHKCCPCVNECVPLANGRGVANRAWGRFLAFVGLLRARTHPPTPHVGRACVRAAKRTRRHNGPNGPLIPLMPFVTLDQVRGQH